MTPLDGHVLTPQGFVDGRIRFLAHGRIGEVSGTAVETAWQDVYVEGERVTGTQ